MTLTADIVATCRVIRSTEQYQGKQGPSYAAGVSTESVGSRGIWLGLITMPPGSRTKAHLHDGHETAIYMEIARAGDYLYIPAGVSHVAVNRSQTEPVIAVGARTDPSEQESVRLQPELDASVPNSTR
jgi:uncharacterized RmlC-like cupin family protein